MKTTLHIENIRVRWSIRWKLLLITTILIISLMMLLTSIHIRAQKAVMEADLDEKIALMRENLIERGKSFAINLTEQVENDIAAFNFSGLMESITQGVAQSEELSHAILLDSSGLVVFHTSAPDLIQTQLQDERTRQALQQEELTIVEYRETETPVIEIVSPIQISTAPWGVLRLIYTLTALEEQIQQSRQHIQQEIQRVISQSLLISSGFMLIAFIGIFLLTTRFLAPLSSLTRAAKRLATGDFTATANLSIQSRDEIGVLSASFIEMGQNLQDSYEQLEEYSRTLEHKVAERTRALHESLEEVEQANTKIMQSIQYAQRIQTSLLPDIENIKAHLPESFFLWMPRDIVGGDMFFTEFWESNFLIAVLDCTGHGVPGALMTMIATSALKQIIRDESCRNPARILKRLNFIIKTSLHQDTMHALSDDGLDAAICLVTPDAHTLQFAGARLPLLYALDGKIHTVKGDRQSVGYKRCELDAEFTEHTVPIHPAQTFYLVTDGFTDQIGGKRHRRFSTRRFLALLREQENFSFDRRRDHLFQAFQLYQGDHERQDDVTVVGFRVKG